MTAAIKFFDCFAGIGGFRSGLEKAGGYECIGFCEIDKNAETAYRAMYDTEKEVFYNDITKIKAEEMPDFDLFVACLLWGETSCFAFGQTAQTSCLRRFSLSAIQRGRKTARI